MPTFLAITSALLLALLIAVIYLNDRVRELEKKTNGSLATEGWGGLAGKVLWDAMTGKPVAGVAAGTVEFLRADYELILSKHIEGLFRDGQQDGRNGQARQASPLRSITSTRGSVTSWMPPKSAGALYRAGVEAARADMYQAESLRMTIDEIAGDLFAQTGLSMGAPFSADLLPPAPEPTAAPPAAEPTPPGLPDAMPSNGIAAGPAPGVSREAAPAGPLPAQPPSPGGSSSTA